MDYDNTNDWVKWADLPKAEKQARVDRALEAFAKDDRTEPYDEMTPTEYDKCFAQGDSISKL